MASSFTFLASMLIGQPVAEKLTKTNHKMWKAQVRVVMRGARLIGHLTSEAKQPVAEITITDGDKEKKELNLAFEEWEARDQQVLSYLLSSLSKDILSQASSASTAAEAWAVIEEIFASRSRARAVYMRIALSNTKKGSSPVAEYFTKMISLGDEMAAAGRPLEDEELVEYILTGLDEEFNPLVSALIARVEPISIKELYSQLLNFQTRMQLIYDKQGGSANYSSRGGRG